MLIPNQHIGAYNVGFMSEWVSREYLCRHNAEVKAKHLTPARCPLFGYALLDMKLDGQFIRPTFLRPETQSKLGERGYDAGAKILGHGASSFTCAASWGSVPSSRPACRH